MIEHLLRGQRVIAIYPLLEDETCWLLAIDFDKCQWQADIGAEWAACDALSVPAVVERSRSGRGAQLWIFFDQPTAAALARNLGCALLTKAIAHHALRRLQRLPETVQGFFGDPYLAYITEATVQSGNSRSA